MVSVINVSIEDEIIHFELENSFIHRSPVKGNNVNVLTEIYSIILDKGSDIHVALSSFTSGFASRFVIKINKLIRTDMLFLFIINDNDIFKVYDMNTHTWITWNKANKSIIENIIKHIKLHNKGKLEYMKLSEISKYHMQKVYNYR